MISRRHVLALAWSLTASGLGCVDTTPPVSEPVWVARNVKGYGETVVGRPRDTAYGWDLRVEASVARWRECTSPEVCGTIERQRPASELLAFAPVGKATLEDGADVEVLKLELEPRPRYVVPVKPTQAQPR